MNDMRKLINLMEGVMAVPGIGKKKIAEQVFEDPREDKLYSAVAALYGPDIWDNDDMYKLVDQLNTVAQPTDQELDQIIATGQLPQRLANFEFGASDELQFGSDLQEKSKSEKQARFMAAAAHDPKFAKKAGISQDVAKEFNKADTGTKQLSNAMKKESIKESYAIDEDREQDIEDALGRVIRLGDSFVELEDALEIVASDLTDFGYAPEDVREIMAAVQERLMSDDEPSDEPSDGMSDVEADADVLASAGWGTDEDYGDFGGHDEFEESKEHQNSVAFNGKEVDISTIEIEGIETRDYPDFADAYVDYAEYTDGTPLSSEELDQFQNENGDLVHELAHNSLHEDVNYTRSAVVGEIEEILNLAQNGINPTDNIVDELGDHFDAVNRSKDPQLKQAYKLVRDAVDADNNTIISAATQALAMLQQGQVEEDFNLQNGYDDINDASGNDYFPNGADSPVVKSVGPSGARQGDNPEQKKMQVDEVHKELVYGYRNFLKESESQKKKLTESAQVSNIQVQYLHENPYADSDSITYDGSISLFANTEDKNGRTVEIGYSVDVKAEAGVGWESDDSPTGWNYRTDSPTYTTYYYATSGDISVTSVQFVDGAEYYINNDAMELKEFYQHLDPMVLKQLLNPEIYVKALGSAFDKAAENIEPPEPDFDEPERYDSRY